MSFATHQRGPQVQRLADHREPAHDRVSGYDLARSLALLGMFIVHFGLVVSADQNRPAWAVEVMKLLDGRAAATFVVLAGIGLTLMSRRAVAAGDSNATSGVRRIVTRRGLFLLGLGFANLAIWPGDILRVYGVSMLLAAWLITAPNRRLLLATAGFVAVFVVLFVSFDYDEHWDWDTMSYRQLWTPDGVVRNLLFDGFRSVFPWTALMLFGMWLGRQNLRCPTMNTRVALTAAGVLLFAEAASRRLIGYFLANPQGMDAETIRSLFWTESMPPLPLFLLAAGATATVIIALSVRLAEISALAGPFTALISTGQMALTWYVAHIIVGLGSVDKLGLSSSQSLPVAQGWGVAFFALAVLASWLWKRWFQHGPLEWMMRRLTR